MKIRVLGAGALGSYVAAELTLAGREVGAMTSGVHPAAIRSHGLELIWDGHRVSMLQDLDRSRSREIDALVTAVREPGRHLVKVAVSKIDTVPALVHGERGRQAGLDGNGAPAKPGLSDRLDRPLAAAITREDGALPRHKARTPFPLK